MHLNLMLVKRKGGIPQNEVLLLRDHSISLAGLDMVCFTSSKIIFPLPFIFRSMSFCTHSFFSITPASSASLGFCFFCFVFIEKKNTIFFPLFTFLLFQKVATFSVPIQLQVAQSVSPSKWGIASFEPFLLFPTRKCVFFFIRMCSPQKPNRMIEVFPSQGIKRINRFHYIDTDSKYIDIFMCVSAKLIFARTRMR